MPTNDVIMKRMAARQRQSRAALLYRTERRARYLATCLAHRASLPTIKALFHGPRTAHLVNLRWVLWRTLRDEGNSYPAIGYAVRRNHSTVMHRLSQEDCPEGYEQYYKYLRKVSKQPHQTQL